MLQHAGRRTGGVGERQRHRERTAASSDSGWRCIGIRLVAVVVAVVIPAGGVVGQDVQFVHLGARVHHHQLVLGNVGRRCRQVGDGLGLDALEVHVAAFALLLFPGHADEGPLDVVVDDLWTTSRAFFDLFFISGITCQHTVSSDCVHTHNRDKRWCYGDIFRKVLHPFRVQLCLFVAGQPAANRQQTGSKQAARPPRGTPLSLNKGTSCPRVSCQALTWSAFGVGDAFQLSKCPFTVTGCYSNTVGKQLCSNNGKESDNCVREGCSSGRGTAFPQQSPNKTLTPRPHLKLRCRYWSEVWSPLTFNAQSNFLQSSLL